MSFFAVTWACATVAVTAGYSVSRYNARRWAGRGAGDSDRRRRGRFRRVDRVAAAVGAKMIVFTDAEKKAALRDQYDRVAAGADDGWQSDVDALALAMLAEEAGAEEIGAARIMARLVQ